MKINLRNNEVIYQGKFEGAKPLQNLYLPLSFQGEGDRGGEVDKQSQNNDGDRSPSSLTTVWVT
ncbi:hypothetical protein ES705_18336 [subsurface metagenome]